MPVRGILRRFIHPGLAVELLAIVLLLPLGYIFLDAFSGKSFSDIVSLYRQCGAWGLLGRTVYLSSLAGVIAVFLAWITARAAGRFSPVMSILIIAISCLPLLIPSTLHANAWILAFGRRGAVNAFLFGPFGFRIDVYSIPAASCALALRYFGLAVLVLIYQLRARARTESAERVFRVPFSVRFIHLRFRPALRGILAAWLIVTLFSMNDHVLPNILTISTFGTQVLFRFQALLDFREAALMGIPLAVMGLLMAGCAFALVRKNGAINAGGWNELSNERRGFWRIFLTAFAFIIPVLVVALPIAAIVHPIDSWSLLQKAVYDDSSGQLFPWTWITLWVSVVSGVGCAFFGAVLGQWWAYRARGGRGTLAWLILLNLMVPASLPAMGIISIFQHEPFSVLVGSESYIPLIFGYVLRFAPIAMLIFYVSARSSRADGFLAARVHGVSRMRYFFGIFLPSNRLMLAGAFLLCAALTIVELETSILLCPVGVDMLSVRLGGLIHTAPDAEVGALAADILILIFPAVVLLCLIAIFAKGRKKKVCRRT